MNKLILSLVGMLFLSSTAQEKATISNSNYAPTNGVYLNPSLMVDSKAWLDINIVGAGAFAHNNYIYLPKSNLYTLLRNNNVTPLDNYNKINKHAFGVANIQGPSLTLNIGEHAVGLNTTLRSFTNVNRVPYELAKFAFEGYDYNDLQNKNFSMKNGTIDHMTWGEIGLSYGKIIKKQNRDLIQVGGTVKRLYGIASAGFQVDELNYIVPNDTVMNVSNFQGSAYYAEPKFGAGKGWGLDLGVTYRKMKSDVTNYVPHSKYSGCEKKDYSYKIGVSLLDVGRINFQDNATRYDYTSGEGNINQVADATFESITDQTNSLVVDNGTLLNYTNYKQHLPTAISVQADYNLGKHVYINGTLIQNVRQTHKTGVIRSNSLTLSARYELKRFEVNLPVTLHQYRYPVVGIMVRYQNIIVGTDYLTPFLFKSNLYRGDIYFNIKLPFYTSPKCKDKDRRGSSSKRGKGSKGRNPSLRDCPTF